MIATNFTFIGWGTANLGELKQIYGAFKALEDLTGNSYDHNQILLLPKGISSVSELKENIVYSQYPNYAAFKKEVYAILDNFFAQQSFIPKVFITAYTQSDNKIAGKNVDTLCRTVKEYYKEHHLGNIFTTVLTSRLYKYKYVDLINIPKHLLTFKSRIRLLQNSALRKKSLITIGTINDLDQKTIKEKKKNLLAALKKFKDNPDLQNQVQKISEFIAAPRRIVFCLGGRVEGPEINFSVQFAKKLLGDALKLASNGYNVIFVNGPRTPNDVCDFIYEQTQNAKNIIFHNCKNIAQTEEDRLPKRWRIYSGKYEKEFSGMLKLGNIYPGILGFENLLVVHTMDSYACCETANAAVTTAICSQGIQIDPDVRYDCYNLLQLLCPKYAINWDDFVHLSQNMKIEPKDLKPQILSSPLRVFAETVLNKVY